MQDDCLVTKSKGCCFKWNSAPCVGRSPFCVWSRFFELKEKTKAGQFILPKMREHKWTPGVIVSFIVASVGGTNVRMFDCSKNVQETGNSSGGGWI